MGDPFPSTHWSSVARAAESEGSEQRAALGRLIERYQLALEKHLVHRFRVAPETATDLVQGFLTEKVLERNLPAQADRTKGRFRNFVLTALDNYARGVLRRKREGAIEDCDGRAGTDGAECADVFEVEWARELVRRAVEDLARVCREADDERAYAVFERRVLRPILVGEAAPPYRELAAELGFRDETQAANALVTAKRRFRGCLRALVAEYEPASPDAEMGALRAVFEDAPEAG